MMASLSDRNLQNAMSCLLDREAQMCAITLADEEEIDALEKKVDEDGVSILLRFQPVASDLRQVISAMKLSSNLERISDQAVKIAERAHSLTRKPVLEEAATLFKLSPEALRSAVERGDVPGRCFGKDWRFSRLALLAWLGRGERG